MTYPFQQHAAHYLARAESLPVQICNGRHFCAVSYRHAAVQ